MPETILMLGDCLERMGEIADQSVDAVICDPPYPCIKRDYGTWTEEEWWALMMGVCRETRRVLKPQGSAVFILQPNSRKVGSMRGWLWRFMAWACDEWNMVQDAWWWNTTAPPNKHANRSIGLMRPSLKACVWLGPADCYRSQDDVLWAESQRNAEMRASARIAGYRPYGGIMNDRRSGATAAERGGVTPFNVLPMPTGGNSNANGHSACTPLTLASWWLRYICPPDGMACDPFMGSGTVPLAALKLGRSCIGIERHPPYFETAEKRIAEARAATPLFAAEPA